MFICGVITILGTAMLTSASSDFIPIPTVPFVGKLPLGDTPEPYDIAGILAGLGIRPDSVEDILVYVFFTGLGGGHFTIPFHSIPPFHSTIPFHCSIPLNKDTLQKQELTG